MLIPLARRMLTEADPRVLRSFLWNCGWKGMRAVRAFERRRKKGEYFPAFLFFSVTNACNLSCQGCWVTPSRPPRHLDLATVDRLIDESVARGSSFFGILGGEPLLWPGLFDLFKRHPDCYFLLFTNGTLVTHEVARQMREAANVSPLISIEGSEAVSDTRRGGSEVYARGMQALDHCRRNRLIFGVATSVCRSNMADLVSDAFINDMARQGAHYLWYYVYRPVGPRPAPELALAAEQIIQLRRFIVDARKTAPLVIVDAYWDHRGRALCPAATGISHHISPAGDVEPCPPVQFATENVGDGRGAAERITHSRFLADFRHTTAACTRGCILMDNPARLLEFMRQAGAKDSSGRGTGFVELAAMTARDSHHLPGYEIPEEQWAYRFAKKHWFFGFGAYG